MPTASVLPSPTASPPASTTPIEAARPDPTAVGITLRLVASGLNQPTDLAAPPDGSGRLFILERPGLIRVIANGQLLPTPFLDLRSLITASGQEQGLLGIAFHPGYAQNGRFFVFYTARNGDNTVAEYRVGSDPARADPATGRVLLAIPDFAPNHNGGSLQFGPDGMLYIGTGDGGGAGDPQRTSQNVGSLLGKLLRIDVDRGTPYAIPPDNPYVGQPGARPEIWAIGLRNPWRFSFDRATGDLWIADVGQNALEEINFTPAGTPPPVNYGWSIMEGSQCFRGTGCATASLAMPVAEYGRALGCSVTGGYVYRGRAFPQLAGIYFYGDYCSGRIWGLARESTGRWQAAELLVDPTLRISSFGEDAAGELYVLDLGGRVFQLVAR
ncbi:MAG: PQQ-dependent sugar dehydrogenase [Dehalococcoidia bacterium]|nr:PQQ-dependent sugar dehydrogenase [Dehalococcoidia bacterium]